MADIGPRDELYMMNPDGKLEKMEPGTHHLEYLMDFYPDEEDYNEDFWNTIFEEGWIRVELRENHKGGWDLALNGQSLYRMKSIVRDRFLERLGRGENKVHIEEWTGTGMNPTHIFYLPAQKDELFDFLFEKMKAKFVYESLEFERRPLSKETLGIGATEILKKFLKDKPFPFRNNPLPLPLMTILKILDNNSELLELLKETEIWDFYNLSQERISSGERELIDQIFSKLYLEKASKINFPTYTNISLSHLFGYDSPEKLMKEMPLTGAAIKQNPLPFVYQGMNSADNISSYFYKYFNPLKYNLDQVLRACYMTPLKIFDYPGFYEYFIKNATPEDKICWGSFGTENIYDKFPEFLEDILKNNIPITDNMASHVIYMFGGKQGEIELLKRYVNSSKNSEILRKIKRKLSRKKWADAFQQIYGIKESQNFERGMDPKEAMEIGTEAQKKKLDKETDWGFEFSHAFRVRTWDIVKYEGFLIKIVQIMGSDGVGYYAALNNTGEPYNNTPPLYNTPEEALDWEQKYIEQYNMGL